MLLTVFLFLSRGLISGAFQAIYVYTPEVGFTSRFWVGQGLRLELVLGGRRGSMWHAQRGPRTWPHHWGWII